MKRKSYLNRLKQELQNLKEELWIDELIKDTEQEIAHLKRELENKKSSEHIKKLWDELEEREKRERNPNIFPKTNPPVYPGINPSIPQKITCPFCGWLHWPFDQCFGQFPLTIRD